MSVPDSITGVMRQAGYQTVSPPILQPAAAFLDCSGESIRRRLFTTTGVGGVEMCLRPDLTIPTCRFYLQTHAPGSEARLCYAGPAFRCQPEGDRPDEFPQAGAESFAAGDAVGEDAAMLDLAVRAAAAAGVSDMTLMIGDLGLLDALADALDLPASAMLRRPGGLRRILADQAPATEPVIPGLSAALAALDETLARRLVDDVISLAGITLVGGRDTADITRRLLEQAATAAITPQQKEFIMGFLKIDVALTDAPAALRDVCAKASVDLSAAIDALEKRIAAINSRQVPLERARFAAAFGRDMDYYTGFVFELRSSALPVDQPLAGGGRYDGLLKALGAGDSVPAVGCALRPDRIAAAMGDSK